MQRLYLICASTLFVIVSLFYTNVSTAGLAQQKYCQDDACKAEMRNLTELARNGSGRAAAFVAMAYASGDGLELNHEKAEHFVKSGVRFRDPVATYLMADWLNSGFVLEQDIEESQRLLSRAVDYAYAPAMYQKALQALNSEQTGNLSGAIALLEKAAEQKHMDSMFLLARLKQSGTVTEQDLSGAGKLYKALVMARHPKAKDYLVQVIEELDSKDLNRDLVADLKSVEDIEVIEVEGQKIELANMLDGLVEDLNESGKFNRNSVGSRIRGVSCAESGLCASKSPSDDPQASSVTELMSGAKSSR
uniref:tetratricopeptide repeat protein n=1 Tax=Ningiella ruwaisensis TaxID=2364274 RepID=UPI0019D6A109|nr:sel1 repeat family protein [Ningiella ruwaisensis]